MSCKVKTKYGTEVRVPSGARSILYEKVKQVIKDEDKALDVYDKIKQLEHTSYDRNGEPNFSFGGQGNIDDVLLTMVVNAVQFKDIVNYRNTHKQRTGNDINKNVRGVADAANNIIAYASGEVNVMHEEALHMAASAVEQHSAYQRAKKLVSRDTNPEMWDKYSEVYDNEDQVRKEIVDLELLKHMSQPLPGRIGRTLQAILDFIKKTFNVRGLKEELGEITSLIVDPNLEIRKIKDAPLQYSLEKGDFTKTMKPYEKTIEDFIDASEKALKRSESLADAKLVLELKQQIKDKRHDLAMIRLVNNAQEKIKISIDRLKELEELGDVQTSEVAKHLLKLKDSFELYNDFIDNVQQIGIKDPRLEEEMDLVASDLSKYRNTYVTMRRKLLGHILLPYFQRNTTVDENGKRRFQSIDDLKEVFEQAEELHYWDNMLSSMADANDDYLKVVDQYVKDALDKIELKSFKEIRKLFALASKIDTSNFDRFFQKVVVEGKTTLGTYLLNNQNTEQYYANMNSTFEVLREEYELPSDKKDRDKHFNIDTESGKEYAEKLLKAFKDGNPIFQPQKYDFSSKKYKDISYDDFMKRGTPNADILDFALKSYKAKQAQWFGENAKASDTLAQDVEDKFNRNLDTFLYLDLAKYKPIIKNHFKNSTIEIDGVKVGYQIGEDFVNEIDIALEKENVTPAQREEIINALNLYKSWYSNNIRNNFKGEYYAAFDLSQPSDEYNSKEYDNITGDDKKFLDYLHELKQKNLDMRKVYPLDLVPQMEQGLQERIESGSPAAIMRSIKEGFKITDSDTEFGEIVDDQKYIPIYFNAKAEDMSRDLITVFSAYLVNANHHVEMSKIEATLNLTLDVAQERDIVKTGMSLFGDPNVVKKGKGGKNAERLEAQLDSVVYGQSQAADDIVPKHLVKPLKKLQSFVSLNNLAYNIYSGVATAFNNTMTRYQERIAERIMGEISKEDYKKADKFYLKYVAGIFEAYQNPATTNKAFILSQFLNITEDFQHDMVLNDLGKNQIINKLKSSTYALNTLGDHFASHKTALAKGFSTKLMKDGKETNLIDAIMESIDEEGMIDFKGYTTPDGKAFTELDAKRMGRVINRKNHKLFGIYNSADKSQLQRYVLGSFVTQFRGFVVSTVNRRWQSRQFDFQLGTQEEGMYRTTGRVLKALYDQGALWDNILLRSTSKEIKKILGDNPEFYKNLIRTKVEIMTIAGALMLGAILTKMAEDDEDNAALAFMAYQANRHYKEISFSLNPRSALDILKSPAAAVNQIDSFAKFFTSFTPVDGMTGGDFLKRYKDGTDETVLQRTALNQLPFYKTINRALDPIQQFNFTK